MIERWFVRDLSVEFRNDGKPCMGCSIERSGTDEVLLFDAPHFCIDKGGCACPMCYPATPDGLPEGFTTEWDGKKSMKVPCKKCAVMGPAATAGKTSFRLIEGRHECVTYKRTYNRRTGRYEGGGGACPCPICHPPTE